MRVSLWTAGILVVFWPVWLMVFWITVIGWTMGIGELPFAGDG